MSQYKPAVTCYGSVGRASSITQDLVDLIPWDYTNKIFGNINAPRVEVILPKIFNQPPVRNPSATGVNKVGFYVKIDVNNRRLSFDARWFDIWAAVISINTMCVRNQKAGLARLSTGLTVKVDRVYAPKDDA